MRTMLIGRPKVAANRSARALLSCLALASLPALGAPTDAGDGGQLASSFGCINCHTSQPRRASSAPPSLKHLAEKVTRKGDPTAALQHLLREMREETSVHTHRMVSDETVLTILQSLALGAK
jgi:cytochrome c551/c552